MFWHAHANWILTVQGPTYAVTVSGKKNKNKLTIKGRIQTCSNCLGNYGNWYLGLLSFQVSRETMMLARKESLPYNGA